MHPIGPELPISAHVACARVCRQLYVLCASHALVQATVGVGTVIIVYIGVAYTAGGGGVHPQEVEQESLKLRMWCLGHFETIQKQPQFQESKGEWLLQEQEQIVEMLVRADTVTEFANIMGLGHMDRDTFLAAVRRYALRKELLADYAGKRFVLAGPVDYDVVTADGEDWRPPSPAGQGLSAQQVAALVQMLAATKLENQRLRAAAIPRLNR